MSFIWAIFFLVLFFAFFGFLSYINPLLKWIFKYIVKAKSVKLAFLVAYARIFFSLALLLDLSLFFLLVGVLSRIPETSVGSISGEISSTCNITGTISFSQPFSIEKSILSLVSAASLGALTAVIAQQMMSLSEKGYSHLCLILLPKINYLICGNDETVNKAINTLPSLFHQRRSEEKIRGILGSMNRHLVN